MKLEFESNGTIRIDDARIVFRNFSGRADRYTREGDRSFSVVIPDQEMADALVKDVNEYGVGWNVKSRPPREDGDDPFMFLKVKVSYKNGKGPTVYLKSGTALRRLNETNVGLLDEISIESVDMDIRPYADIVNGRPFRAAYLQAIHVTQRVDRFAERYADEEDDY